MRKLILLAALLGPGMISTVAPAVATDQQAAIEICSKNRACGLARVPGGVNLWTDTFGGRNEVYCPDKGPCVCTSCSPPPKREGGLPANPRDVGYLLRLETMAPESLSSPSSGPAQTPTVDAPAPAPQQPPIL